MPAPTTVDVSAFKTPTHLRPAILIASASGDRPTREAIAERAKELDCSSLIPAGWLDAPAPTPSAAPSSTAMLDEPATGLFQLDRREDLDRVVRTAERALQISYPEALTLLTDSADALKEVYKATPDTTRSVLAKMGIRELDLFADDVRLTGERDEALVRELDAGMTELSDENLDAQGRVLLDADADVATLLNDPTTKERRFRQARERDPRYASREVWDADEAVALEANIDLIATMDRPAKMAAVRRGVAETAKQLDAVLETDRTASARTRELDQVITSLEARRNQPGRGDGVKELDRSDAAPPTFIDLDGASMLRALEVYDERRSLTLDQAAAVVAGYELEGEKPYSLKVEGVTNTPPDAAAIENLVGEYMQLHPGTPYATAVTNVVADLHGSW